MRYRIDPKTGNRLSALGLGFMRVPRDFEKAEELTLQAIERGVNYFDTAYMYRGNEEALGKILAKNDVRGKVYIATKLPLLYCRSSSDFDKYFDRQLERLRTDYIDYYLMHMLTDESRWDTLRGWGIEDWIKRKKERGQIGQIGFSFHGAKGDFLRLLDVYDWEFCMIQYNYADENDQAGVAGLKKAAEKGLPVFVMEPLLGGKLANGLPPEAVQVFQRADPALSPAAWALKWVWDQPEVTVLVSGMNEAEQLEENVRTAETALPNTLAAEEREVLNRVVEIFKASYKVQCTGCDYCMPCPYRVNIPACFAAYNASFSMGKIEGIKQYLQNAGALSQKPGYASLCTKCGKCAEQCPQRLEIAHLLAETRKRMEPFWFKPLLTVARRALGVGRA